MVRKFEGNKMNNFEKSLGRDWKTADKAILLNFGDCWQVRLYWNDGAETYTLHDEKEEAIKHLNHLGFFERRTHEV